MWTWHKRYLSLLSLLLLGISLQGLSATQAQTTIDASTFGSLEARSIGPAVTSGRIMAIDGVNSDPNTLYIGAASGGVWKTTNGGHTFKPIFDKYSQSIGAIAIDQGHPNNVWVGTGESCTRNSVSVGTGIYKTTDGGENWQSMGLEKSERISKVAIDPKKPDTIYVSVVGNLWNDSEDRGLYKTTDAGKTWQKILYVDAKTGCADIAIDPQEPDRLYASMWQFRRQPWAFSSGGPGSGLYKSTDAGKTWKKVTQGLPEGSLGRIALAIAPTRPNLIYATVEATKSGLFKSEDLGETWTRVNSSFNVTVRPFYFSHLIVDPKDYKRIYKPGFMLTFSNDGGQTFNGIAGDVHGDMHALWIDPNNTGRIFLGTDGGVYQTTDSGVTWRFMRNLPVAQFYHVAYDMEIPYNVYGGLQDNGSWRGPSQGIYGGIANKHWKSIGFGDGFSAFPDRTDRNIAYSEYQGGKLLRYDLTTGEVKAIQPLEKEKDPKYRFNWNTPFVASQKSSQAIYVGGQFLFRSTDKGESWQRISEDLTTNDPKKQSQEDSGGLSNDNSSAENHCTIFTVRDSPLDENIIWVGTDDGNLQLTRDGGKNWTNLIANLPGLPANTWCSSVEPSHFDAGTAYATFEGHATGDMKPYVYKTSDFGKTWQLLTTEAIKGYVHVVREDFVNSKLLFLGTEFGLFISLDGGKQWAAFTNKLPLAPVHDLAIQPRESDLIIATHGRGIYIIDDISPLRQLDEQVLNSNVTIFKSRPAQIKFAGAAQEWNGDDEFIGANLRDAAYITYYMKERPLVGVFKVEIYDAQGKLITTLPGSKRRGINRLEWTPRMKPPQTASGETIAQGALVGPSLPEGTYTVKIIKGSDTYTGSVVLIGDTRLSHSEADRHTQQETTMKLYNLQERLAFIAEVITDTRDQAKDRLKQLKDKPASTPAKTKASSKQPVKNNDTQPLEDLVNRLDALRKTLATNKADSFYGIKGEEQLREKIVELYSTISSFGGRPTLSQLERLQTLTSQVEKSYQDFQTATTNLTDINTSLSAQSLTPIKLLTPEQYQQRVKERQPSGGQLNELLRSSTSSWRDLLFTQQSVEVEKD